MKKPWSKIPPAVITREKPRALISTGLGCFVPFGIFVLLFLPPAQAIRMGLPLMFLGVSISLVGLTQYMGARKNSLICPNCQKRVYNAKKWKKPVCHHCLNDIPGEGPQ